MTPVYTIRTIDYVRSTADPRNNINTGIIIVRRVANMCVSK